MSVKLHHRQPIFIRLVSIFMAGWVVAAFLPAPLWAIEVDIRRDAVVEAIDKVMPSVVNIATSRIVEYRDFYQDPFWEFFGHPPPTQKREQLNSIGSGVIIDEDGYILTNLHVLRRASRIQVKLWDGRVYDAEPIVGTTQKDVALLKLKAKPGEKFKAIKFAKDDDILLGETVIALGNPYGLGASASRGILSSKNRRPPTGDEPLNVADWLQTDASINPGNSGGPLIDLRGDLIGINVAVYREQLGMGVGFAIPVKQISDALAEFFTPEAKDGIWFGARVKVVAGPLMVTAVQPGSPAERAGLREGQQIVQVNGRTPKSLVDFNHLLTAGNARSATLLVEQQSQRRTVRTQLVPFTDLIRQKLGLVLTNLTSEAAASFQVKTDDGMLIEQVDKNSPADKAQLQRGFLLTGIDNHSAANLLAVADVVSTKKPGDWAHLSVVALRQVADNQIEYRQGPVDVEVR